ncbi:MAG: VOC family protein [Prevotellaceae bacterium]|jgi:uncharacterized glyoxalase superfamily protein PhnB|nr:VOC family protein [Prevotellaceae bacterium]
MELSKLTPNFAVADIRETVHFYREKLGFELVILVPESQDSVEQQFAEGKEYVYAMMKKGNVELMFQRYDSFHEDVSLADKKISGASVSFFIEGEGVEAFYDELKNRGIEMSELKLTWYNIREFYLKDNNGYILGFAEEKK